MKVTDGYDTKKRVSLNESPQSYAVRMCFVHRVNDEHYERLHVTVKCRDYLGDILHSEFTGESFSIYGFTTAPKNYKIDRDAVRLYLNFPSAELCDQFKAHLPLLNRVEKSNKLTPTSYKVVTSTELIVEGDSKWMDGVFYISLYSYLLKCMAYRYEKEDNWLEELAKKGDIEGRYLAQLSVPRFSKLLQSIKKLPKPATPSGWAKDVSESHVHSASGFMSCMTQAYEANEMCVAITKAGLRE